MACHDFETILASYCGYDTEMSVDCKGAHKHTAQHGTYHVAFDGRVGVQNPHAVLVLGAVKHAEGALDDVEVQKVQHHDAQAAVAVQEALEASAGTAVTVTAQSSGIAQ